MASVQDESGHGKEGKESFDHIYDLEDPREYFETLGRLDYRAPQNAYPLFSALVEARKRVLGREALTVVDLCCSYGVNGALLKYDVTLDDLYARYGSDVLTGLSSEQLAVADAAFFGGRKRERAPKVVGLDVAANAVGYALRADLIDEGFAENLEVDEPSDALKKAISGAGLLTVTGGVGYVWGRTFDRLLGSMAEAGSVPWVATFPTRMVNYGGPILEALSRYGLVTEKLPDLTFVQRRFADAAEQEYVLAELANMGVDPAGKEADGYYHTDFYLSRPSEAAAEIPLDTLGVAALPEEWKSRSLRSRGVEE